MLTRHVTDQLTPYADGQIDGALGRAIARHLEGCETCRTALEDVRRGIALASELQTEPMPQRDARAIARALEKGDGRAGEVSMGRWRWGLAASAALLALVSALAIYVQLHRPWVETHAADARPFTLEHEARGIHQRVRSVEPGPASRIEVAGAAASVSSYRIDGRPVTLVAAQQKQVIDAPAAGWIAKRVEHRRTPEGWHTLAWSSGGETYVLVKDQYGLGKLSSVSCQT